MPIKTCAVQVKATAADDKTLKDGQFKALASVFNNVDAVGDVVMPGAFADDLKAWEESGDPIPVLWGHQMSDPDFNIGHVVKATETDTGLEVLAELDLDNTKAAQVYRLLKGKRVKKMSFAYDVLDGAPAERDGQSVYELRKLKVHEVSVVQVPANPAAVIQQVKAAADRRRAQLAQVDDSQDVVQLLEQVVDLLSDGAPQKTAETGTAAKAGRALSAKNESALRKALDKITAGMTDISSVLDSLPSDDGKANPPEPATAEEPHGVKTDTPAPRPGPAALRLRADLDAATAEVLSLTD